MTGINKRIFQFKILLDKEIYYFGPRTVAKYTIKIKLYSENTCVQFFLSIESTAKDFYAYIIEAKYKYL